MKPVEREIGIKASKEKVRDVLLRNEPARIRYAEFCEGAHPVSDRQVRSRAVFTDAGGNGLIASVTQHTPAEFISTDCEGELVDGREEYDTPVAKEIRGGKESHRLSGGNGTTHLAISGAMNEAVFEPVSAARERPPEKIKALAEKEGKQFSIRLH